MFGFIKRKREERIAIIAIAKADHARLFEKCEEMAKSSNEWKMKRVNESNSVCPKCKSVEIINHIKHIQGEINGSSSGSSWSALTFGSSYSSGSLSGSIDTKPILKCKGCGHEWFKKEFKYTDTITKESRMYGMVNNLKQVVKDNIEADSLKYNPLDPAEKYFSLEEKKKSVLNLHYENMLNQCIEFWKGTSIEAIDMLCCVYRGSGFDKKERKILVKLGILGEAG